MCCKVHHRDKQTQDAHVQAPAHTYNKTTTTTTTETQDERAGTNILNPTSSRIHATHTRPDTRHPLTNSSHKHPQLNQELGKRTCKAAPRAARVTQDTRTSIF